MNKRDNERFEKVVALIKEKAKEILPQGSTVTLFGSRARGDAREDSDWDIHILIPGPERINLDEMTEYVMAFDELGWDNNEEINAIVHTFDGWEKRRCILLYYFIRDEGILLYDYRIR